MCPGYFIYILLCMAINIVTALAEINPCDPNPCMNGADCIRGVELNFTCGCTYDCSCANNVEIAGTLCENDLITCNGYPRGGEFMYAHNCSQYLNCWTDTLSDCPPGLPYFQPGVAARGHPAEGWCDVTPPSCFTTPHIDECASSPCQNGGTCSDKINGYECKCAICGCADEEAGPNCEIDTSGCRGGADGFFYSPITCSDYIQCVNYTIYEKSCPMGSVFIIDDNTRCENPENLVNHTCAVDYTVPERRCPNMTCSNGGTCEDTVDGYVCTCLSGFTGLTCEGNIDECEFSTCKNGATCKDGINAYVCDCEDGFEGDDCGTSVDWFLLFSCDIDETVAMLDLQKGTIKNILSKETFTSPRGLTYDEHRDTMYVIDGVDVWTISLDEPARREKIHTLPANGQDIALDYSTGWLYVSKSDYALERVDSNGVSQYTYDNWYGLGFDHIGGYLYWVTNGFIKRESSLDISNMTSDIVVNMGQSSIKDVYIDSKRDLIFWCTSVGHVYQSTMSGSVVELIVHIAGETLDYITGIGRHLYIGGYSNNRGAGAIFDIYNGSYSILEVSRSISPFGIVAFSKPSKVCPFECQNGGTLDLETCICECPSQWMGVACDVQPETRSTEVVNVWPNFGPEAGGTAITCTGMHLPHQYPITVNIGYKKCNTTKQNSTTVIAVTPSLGESESELIGADLPVYLTVGHINLTTPYTFVYKGNPVIDDVYPKESIVKGGTKLTANGNNLDSVAVIVMDTTMVYRKRIARVYNETIVIYKTNCDTQNRTQMVCPTPAIELPEEFKNTSTKTTNGGDSDVSISVGNNTLEFYVGFRLDGVKGYDNFSDLKIFAEPVFKVESDRKIIFVQNERIEFAGDNIDKGITVYDYSITIGKGDCGRLELLYNSLSCMPPQNEPERLDENSNLNNPRIVIHAGLNIKHAAGYLVYPDSELPWYILYIVVPVCGVILIVIIIVIIVVCCKRRNMATRPKEAMQKDN